MVWPCPSNNPLKECFRFPIGIHCSNSTEVWFSHPFHPVVSLRKMSFARPTSRPKKSSTAFTQREKFFNASALEMYKTLSTTDPPQPKDIDTIKSRMKMNIKVKCLIIQVLLFQYIVSFYT